MRSGYYNYYRVAPPAAAVMGTSLAGRLLGTEAQGLAIDFTDMSMVIKDTGTPSNAFSGNPNSKLTYASPSTKWILGLNGLYASGTALRTAYDITGTALGVLVEEARTNLVTNSLMGNALGGWVGNFSTRTLSSAVDPFGTQNAMNVVTTGNAGLNVSQAVTVTNGAVYTGSAFVKGTPGQQIYFVADGTAAGHGRKPNHRSHLATRHRKAFAPLIQRRSKRAGTSLHNNQIRIQRLSIA